MSQDVSGQYMQLFEGRKVRTVWDESAQEWYFSVADVVAVLTDSSDVKQYIKKMRTRDPELGSRWGTICTPTRMMASDGKCSVDCTEKVQFCFNICTFAVQFYVSLQCAAFKL